MSVAYADLIDDIAVRLKEDMQPIKKVAVFVAMEAEAKPLLEVLGFVVDNPPRFQHPAFWKSYTTTVDGLEINLVTSGKDKETSVDNISPVPAGIAAYSALQVLKPDLAISAGTAGGFIARGGEIGKVYLSSCCLNHDKRIDMPGFDIFGLGLKKSVTTTNLQLHLGVEAGSVSTGNSLDYTERDIEIMKAHNVVAKEMEAAAIAWVAELYDVPFFCVKAITDLVDGDRPTADEFLQNLSAASDALKTAMVKVLEFVDGRLPSEL